MGVEIWNTEGQLHFDQVFALKETTCIAIFKKQKCHFFLFQKRYMKAIHVLSGGLVPMGGGGYKERV
jgi:hypothetical protein